MSRILSLGCGRLKHENAVTVDNRPEVEPDVVHDLEKFPWPLRALDFDEVFAIDVLEHLSDTVRTMDEIHRILKPQGKLHIRTNHWQSENAFTDPTHKKYFTQRTFDYFDPSTALGKKYDHYTSRKWKITSQEMDGQEQVIEMERI